MFVCLNLPRGMKLNQRPTRQKLSEEIFRAWCKNRFQRSMAARARELGGTLTFRRSRLGGLQVQVDIPTPCATNAARQTAAGTRVTG